MDDEAVIFSVSDGFLEGHVRLIMAVAQRVAHSRAEAEVQISLLVQIGDQLPDPLETIFIEVAVHIQLKAVGNGVDGKVVGIFPAEIQQIFMERDLQIFPVLGGNMLRVDQLDQDHQLGHLGFLP